MAPVTTAFTISNVVRASAVATTYVPSVSGIAVPANAKAWQLQIDTTGMTAGQLLDVSVEYQRNAWIDNAGVSHPANEWIQDFRGPDMTTGTQRDGTLVAKLGSTIGATHEDGSMVEPYPIAVRGVIHTSSATGTFPSVSLTVA